MIVKIPNNNVAERKYIINVMLGEFLGLEYDVKVEGRREKVEGRRVKGEGECYEIILDNGNKLIIEDHFFSKFPNDLEYLNEKNIPQKVEFAKNEFTPEDDIPIIYGSSTFALLPSTLTCGIDIFASSFFMLTRWEEYANKTRDNHNRFPATASLAFKNNFLHRLVVNEYLEMLKNMLLHLGLSQKLKTRNYKLTLTHDIDHIYAWNSLKKILSQLIRDMIKRTSIKNFFWTLDYYIKIKRGLAKDPYDTFDYIMNLSDKIGAKSHFFFMGRGQTKHDNDYFSGSKDAIAIAKNIKKRGHYIGIHPTYNAYNNFEQFKAEKDELEQNLNTKIKFGREHYLRFEVPTTWQIWEDNNMEWDSTLSFADEDGFRCGVCYEYRVFNILTRKHLNLKEKPLIFMDAIDIEKLSPKQMQKTLLKLISQVERYKGEAVILWHNSNYNTIKWLHYKKVYEALIDFHLKISDS